MGDAEREQLRRLAVWLASRRDVDRAVAQLTHYGPAATEQVAAHLAALRQLLDLEAAAFAAVEAGAAAVPQLPLAVTEPLRATVHSIREAQKRREQA